MDLRRFELRRTGSRIALAVAVLASCWWAALWFGARVDIKVLGLRIRATDPYHSGLVAILGFVVFGLLRRPIRLPRISRRALVSRTYSILPIAGVLLVASAVRFWGLWFGLPHINCRPDEGGVASIAGGYFFGGRPPSFNYPPLFMLVIAAVMHVLLFLQHLLSAIFGVHWSFAVTSSVAKISIARLLSAATGAGTVFAVFHASSLVFDRRVALTAAGCLTVAFLHVRDSHFGVTDVPMTFMLVLAFVHILKLSKSGSNKDLIWAAVLAGLATATKYNAAFLAFPATLAVLDDPRRRPIRLNVVRLALFGAVMLAAFVAVCPWLVLDPNSVLGGVAFESRHLATGHGLNLGRGWSYHFMTTLPDGLGRPLFFAGLAGLVLLFSRRPRTAALISLFPVSYYVLAGSGYTVFTRYMIPVVPFVCVSAGYFVIEVAAWTAARLGSRLWTPAITVAGVALLISPAAFSTYKFDRLLARDDTRLLARRWIEAHFPPGSRILQFGPNPGQVFIGDDNEPDYVRVELMSEPFPDVVVIVQSSPVSGPTDLESVKGILTRDYTLRAAYSGASDDPANVYDRQDAFYLPFAGFRNIERPGPNLELYTRRN